MAAVIPENTGIAAERSFPCDAFILTEETEMRGLRELSRRAGFENAPSLRAVARHYGVASFLAAAAAQDIDEFHADSLGILAVGSPNAPLQQAADGSFQQTYNFGSIIKPRTVPPFVSKRFHVTVQLAGVRCFATDDPSGTDEPYLITTVYAIDLREGEKSVQTTLVGPDDIGDISVGDVFAQGRQIATDFTVPGDSDIRIHVQLWDEEALGKKTEVKEAVNDAAKVVIAAGAAALGGAVGAGSEQVLDKLSGLFDLVSNAIGDAVVNLLADELLGQRDVVIPNRFLQKLLSDPESLDRQADPLHGTLFNIPENPEDPSCIIEDGKGTYRFFFRIAFTEA